MRSIQESFVVESPKALSIPAKLHTTPEEHDVLVQIGICLAKYRNEDWVKLLKQNKIIAEHKKRIAQIKDKQEKKQARADLKEIRKDLKRERRAPLTKATTSRWADSIIAENDKQLRLATDNLYRYRRTSWSAISTLEKRLNAPIGGKDEDGNKGYATKREHAAKQLRLDNRRAHLDKTQRRIDESHPSVQFGGKALAKKRKNITDEEALEMWRCERLAERMFVKAVGDKNMLFGNQTIRCHPATGILTMRLPDCLAHLSNTSGKRPDFEFGRPLVWHHRGDEWAAHVASSAMQYEFTYDCSKHDWYAQAIWKRDSEDVEAPELEDLRRMRSLNVDVNYDHLACYVQDEYGNFVGAPLTIKIPTSGSASTRDGHPRAAITKLINYAVVNNCGVICIEDLNFQDARDTGRETMGRGRRGKSFRKKVLGMATGKFREFLRCMAYNEGIHIIAVDPAYTSIIGKRDWLQPIKSSQRGKHATSHHAACQPIGRRARGFKVGRKIGAVAGTQRNTCGEQSSSLLERDPAPDDDLRSGAGSVYDGDNKRVGAGTSQLGRKLAQVVAVSSVAEPSLVARIRDDTVRSRSEGHSSVENLVAGVCGHPSTSQ